MCHLWVALSITIMFQSIVLLRPIFSLLFEIFNVLQRKIFLNIFMILLLVPNLFFQTIIIKTI